MKPIKNKVLSETLWAATAKGISILGGLFFTIFIPKLGGVELYGNFSLILIYISIFGILFGAQVSSSIKSEITKHKIHQTSYNLFIEAFKLKFLLSVGSSIFIIILIFFLKIPALNENVWTFLILLGIMNLWGLIVMMFETIHKLVFEAVMYFIEYSTQVGLILYFYFHNSLTLHNILVAFLIGYLLSFIFGLLQLRKLFTSFKTSFKFFETIKVNKKLSLKIALLSLTSGALVIMYKVDSLIISVLLGIKNVGFYNIASDLVKNMPILSVPIMLGALPLFFDGNPKKIFIQNILIISLLNLSIFIILFFYGEELIAKIYGENYTSTGEILKILSIYPLFISLQAFIQEILILNDSIKHVFYSNFIAIITNITLTILLVHRFGIIGAAYASVISSFIWLCISFQYVKKYIH